MRFFTNSQLWVAEAKSNMADTAMMNTKMAFTDPTSISSKSVLKINRNGKRAVLMS